MHKLKIYYKKLPIFFQNLALTFFNNWVKYKKHGFAFFNNNRELLKINDTDSLISRLNNFKNHALLNSEYYQLRRDSYPDISDLSEITNWPILEKNDLKRNIHKIYSSNINFFNSTYLSTSGSTGSPLKVIVSFKDLQKRFNVFSLIKKDIISNDDIIVRLSGNDIACENLIYRKDYLSGEIFFSAFHISAKNIHKYFNAITELNVSIIEGYPSAIFHLAKLMKSKNYKVNSLKHIYTTAEKLHGYQKTFIENFFRCKVTDYYGSNDQSPFIFSCNYGKYHVSDTTGVVEVLSNNNVPVNKGEQGKMVITSFTSSLTPLIRYDIGDVAKLSILQECKCGQGGVILDEIFGRDEEVFKLRNGSYFTRFSLILKFLPDEVFESQLRLSHSNFEIKLNYTSDAEIEHIKFQPFINEVSARLGENYFVILKRVNNLKKSSKGKSKTVIIDD